MKTLKFSKNWNNKLECDYFTTIRLDASFQIGEEVQVLLKGEHFCFARIKLKKHIHIDKVNDWIGFLDAGHTGDYTASILKRMYNSRVADWRNTHLWLYMLERKDD